MNVSHYIIEFGRAIEGATSNGHQLYEDCLPFICVAFNPKEAKQKFDLKKYNVGGRVFLKAFAINQDVALWHINNKTKWC